MTTWPALKSEYADLINTAEIDRARAGELKAIAAKIIANKTRYEQVEAETAVPWYVVGIIHTMECGGRFDQHLHNGDPLTAKTVCVPAKRPLTGRAPYDWHTSACDALEMKKLRGITWTLERICYEMERYNGFGYRRHHAETLSPYLWSGTSHYTRGKYVADGQWSATAVSKQLGGYAILLILSYADTTIDLTREPSAINPEAHTAESFRKAEEVAEVAETKPLIKSETAQAGAAGAAGSLLATYGVVTEGVNKAVATDASIAWKAWMLMSDITVIGALVALAAGIFTIWHRYSKSDIEGMLK